MSERFDSLSPGRSETDAVDILRTEPAELPNPGTYYFAASRLGAASSSEALVAINANGFHEAR